MPELPDGVGGRPGEWTCLRCLPPSWPMWKAQTSETKAISSYSGRARSSGCPALTCALPEVCNAQKPGCPQVGGHVGRGRCCAPCIHGRWKPDNFVSQGRTLLKFHLPCSGPRRDGGLGYRRTAWNNTQPQGMGCAAPTLAEGVAPNAPLLVICGGYGTAFQPGIRHHPDGLDLSMCRSLSHKETNKK